MYSKRTVALGLFVLWLTAQLAVAQHYTITDLGPLSPTAINTWGQVVGNYNGHAFMWTKSRGMRDLGTIPGGTFSRAVALNDLGTVTGTADGPGTVISQIPNLGPNQECRDLVQPFVWTQRNGMRGLGTVGFSGDFGHWCSIPFYSRGINDLGQVVGYTAEFGSLYQYGFLWTSSDGMTFLWNNWPPTFANAINNRSEAVGQQSSFGLPYRNVGIGNAVSWSNGIVTNLDSLGGGFDYGSSANGVNDLGQVVGWSSTSPVSSIGVPVHSVLWTPSGEVRDLKTLSGDTSSAASKINLFGQVIGSSGETLYVQFQSFLPFEVIGRPFVWSERSGMRDLNTLIRGNSKWVLSSATDINVWGQIVGQGMLNGKPHGFLLTPRAFFKF